MVGSTAVAARADTIVVVEPMTASPNPSVQGQLVVFRIAIEHYCDYGGHPFAVYDGDNVIGYAQIPYPGTGFAAYAYGLLSVGSHRMRADTPYCWNTADHSSIVSISTNVLTQVVNPKPAPAPPPPPPSPPPPPPPPPSPSPTPSEAASPTPEASPSPPAAGKLVASPARVLTGSKMPGGLAAGAGLAVLVLGLGASLYWRRRIVTARRRLAE